jgi:hypothetical protein
MDEDIRRSIDQLRGEIAAVRRGDTLRPSSEGFHIGPLRFFVKLVGTAFHLFQQGEDGTEIDLTDGITLQGIPISVTDPTTGQVLTYNASTGEWEPTAPGSPGAHVLATTAGLGASHTTSGLTAGQVLRATAADAAAFQAIQDADIPATHSGSAHHGAVTIGADGEHSLATQVLSGVAATAAQAGHATAAQITKLDGIEAAADVTDATNVEAAGAVMVADADWIDLTDAGETALHTHAGGSGGVGPMGPPGADGEGGGGDGFPQPYSHEHRTTRWIKLNLVDNTTGTDKASWGCWIDDAAIIGWRVYMPSQPTVACVFNLMLNGAQQGADLTVAASSNTATVDLSGAPVDLDPPTSTTVFDIIRVDKESGPDEGGRVEAYIQVRN